MGMAAVKMEKPASRWDEWEKEISELTVHASTVGRLVEDLHNRITNPMPENEKEGVVVPVPDSFADILSGGMKNVHVILNRMEDLLRDMS